MIVALSSLGSLLSALQDPPTDSGAAKELFWEAKVFKKAVSAVSAHDGNADPVTAAELLGLAAQVADQIVRINGRLAAPPERQLGAAGEEALRALAFTTAAASEVADGLLALLQLPFVHDEGIAQRLAASSIVAVGFSVPQATFEHGLAGIQVAEAVASTARHAVEWAVRACNCALPASLLCAVVCRPGTMHGFLHKAVDAIQASAVSGAGSRDWLRVREHLAHTLYLVLSEEVFRQEAQHVLADPPLVKRVMHEVRAWRLQLLENADAGSRDWRAHIEVARGLEHMPELQQQQLSTATTLLAPEEEEGQLGGVVGPAE